MKLSIQLLIALLLCCGICNAAQRGASYSKAPKGFVELPAHKRGVTRTGSVTATLALKQRNMDVLEAKFWAVSDPNHEDYGNHMTFQEVIDLVAPVQADIDKVSDWMTSKGVKPEQIKLHQSRDFMMVDLAVEEFESLFQAPLTPYVHKRSRRVSVRTDSGYVLPDEITSHIDFVSPLMDLNNVEAMAELPQEEQPLREKRQNNNKRDATAPALLWADVDDAYFSFNSIAIYCPDGSDATTNDDGDAVYCGSTTLQSVLATPTNQVTNQVGSQQTLDVFACGLCRDDASCSQVTSIDQYSLICATTGFYYPNYTPFTVTVQVQWQGGQTSDSATTSTYECVDETSPGLITSLYNIPNGAQQITQSGATQAVVQFDETYLRTDVQSYFEAVGLPDPTGWLFDAGSESKSENSGEGILDIDCIMSTARGATTYFWANNNNGYAMYNWIVSVLNTNSPPLVNSISYDLAEDPAAGVDTRANSEFIKAGARGLTILSASGDTGVRETGTNVAYTPLFPASSPYVTAVGATQLYSASTSASCYNSLGNYTCGVTEISCSTATGALITSGGGFSGEFTRPSYQNTVVENFLNAQSPTGINANGRGYPDISVIGHNIVLYLNGKLESEDGTSASTPLMAGMVTILNNLRLSNGKSPMGFINPFLYGLDSSYFNDVTVGNNKCVPDVCTNYGFTTTTGWDAVTGLGSPKMDKIYQAVQNLGNYDPISSENSSASVKCWLSLVVAAALFVLL